MPPDAPDQGLEDRTGQKLGGYRIVAELGAGAMGRVYYAEHEVIGRRVAIKVLDPSVARDPDAVSRFITEARAVNGIRHPNIVDITDFAEHDGAHYIVMELLEGETLGERLEREQRCSEQVTVRICAQIAAALAAAHDHGIVHRDLKPENVFICNHPDYPDSVRVLDFGIAKLVGVDDRVGHKTKTGAILGTPLYMSPEQCLGDVDLDHRSDIYSLGTVMYEMLTGKTPFDGAAVGRIILQHINDAPVPPVQVRAGLSAPMNALVLRALAKDPRDRFRSMRELRAAMLAAIEPVSHPNVSSTVSSPPSVVAAATAIATDDTPGNEAACAAAVRFELMTIILDRIESNRLVLPAMPAVAMECTAMLGDSMATFSSIAACLERDPLLVPQVISRANSAAMRGTEAAETVEQAISRIGLSALRTLLVRLSAHTVFKSRNDGIWRAFQGVWEHSLAVARGCRAVVRHVPAAGDREVAYMAGLLHDVGKPVLGSLMLEAEKLLSADQREWIDEAVWLEIVHETHRRVGEAVAIHWKLPDGVRMAIRRAGHYDVDAPARCANVVCLANALAKREGVVAGPYDAAEVDALVDEGQRLLGLDDGSLDEVVAVIADDGAVD